MSSCETHLPARLSFHRLLRFIWHGVRRRSTALPMSFLSFMPSIDGVLLGRISGSERRSLHLRFWAAPIMPWALESCLSRVYVGPQFLKHRKLAMMFGCNINFD